MALFKKVTEASYLTVDKAWSYRAILRYFYVQHERMREFLFPQEVLEHLHTLPEFADYTEEQLHQDLAQLESWNNLIAHQELGKAKSIEEFKKKRYRYQCTPYTVEFERMLEEMEESGESFGGSLEKTQFERLLQMLYQIETAIKKSTFPSPADCAQIWHDVFTYYRTIRKSTSDYIAHMNSEEAQERMHTEAFLVFKDQFTTYLRDFMIELQHTSLKIQQILQSIDKQKLTLFVEQVIIHQQKAPRFEDIETDEKILIDAELHKWKSLHIWFLGNEHGESELEMLQNRTNEQIRQITRVVQRLGERHQYFRSRKKDYLHLASWFDSFEHVDNAHELSAVIFGVFHTRHLFSDHVPTENIYTSIWEEKPMTHETNPRIRNYREKTRPGAIVNKQEEIEAVRRQFLRDKEIERETIEKYMKHNEIHLENLPVVEPYVRKLLLSWIGKAMMRKDRTIQTEHGRKLRVTMKQGERAILQATDGTLNLPKVIFRFLDEDKISS